MQDKPSELTGTVDKSETTPRGCGGLITKLIIIPESESGVVIDGTNGKPEINLPGRHPVRVGDRVRINYVNHSQVYWGVSYDVLDARGNILHSDVTDDVHFHSLL